MMPTLPALFVPHGAPTLALNPGTAGAAMRATAQALPRPRAIVVVSAHWDTDVPTLGIADDLETIHDFWGFPAPLYDIRYPARSSLTVAEEVHRLLQLADLSPRFDSSRGLDHGAWIPLRLMFPDAAAQAIPVIPLSIQGSRGPEHHFRMGRALAPLLAQGILVLASGNLTHNLMDFRRASASGTPPYVGEFADWMWHQLSAGNTAALLGYRQQAPHAVRAHPSEDHLLSLYVALGAGGPDCIAERLYTGIDSLVLAMDMYAFHTKHISESAQ